MKGVLSFTLPKEEQEFKLAQNASLYQGVLFDMENEVLRKVVKFGVTTEMIREAKISIASDYPHVQIPSDSSVEVMINYCYAKIREELFDLLNASNIDIV